MCRRVDLPAPDGAISATDWPGQTASSALLRMSSVLSPWPKRREIPCRKRSGRCSPPAEATGAEAAVAEASAVAEAAGAGVASMMVVFSSIAGHHS